MASRTEAVTELEGKISQLQTQLEETQAEAEAKRVAAEELDQAKAAAEAKLAEEAKALEALKASQEDVGSTLTSVRDEVCVSRCLLCSMRFNIAVVA